MIYVVGYIAALIAFLAVDMVWLQIVAKGFFQREVGQLLKEEPLMVPAVLFYTLYIAIMLYLVVVPYLGDAQWGRVILGSALFGIAAYGTFDMTSYALIKGWSGKVAVIDILWGGFVTSLAGAAGYGAMRWWA